MYLAAVFLLFLSTLWAAWQSGRQLALRLFAVSLLVAVLVYFHHATDTLGISL